MLYLADCYLVVRGAAENQPEPDMEGDEEANGKEKRQQSQYSLVMGCLWLYLVLFCFMKRTWP